MASVSTQVPERIDQATAFSGRSPPETEGQLAAFLAEATPAMARALWSAPPLDQLDEVSGPEEGAVRPAVVLGKAGTLPPAHRVLLAPGGEVRALAPAPEPCGWAFAAAVAPVRGGGSTVAPVVGEGAAKAAAARASTAAEGRSRGRGQGASDGGGEGADAASGRCDGGSRSAPVVPSDPHPAAPPPASLFLVSGGSRRARARALELWSPGVASALAFWGKGAETLLAAGLPLGQVGVYVTPDASGTAAGAERAREEASGSARGVDAPSDPSWRVPAALGSPEPASSFPTTAVAWLAGRRLASCTADGRLVIWPDPLAIAWGPGWAPARAALARALRPWRPLIVLGGRGEVPRSIDAAREPSGARAGPTSGEVAVRTSRPQGARVAGAGGAAGIDSLAPSPPRAFAAAVSVGRAGGRAVATCAAPGSVPFVLRVPGDDELRGRGEGGALAAAPPINCRLASLDASAFMRSSGATALPGLDDAHFITVGPLGGAVWAVRGAGRDEAGAGHREGPAPAADVPAPQVTLAARFASSCAPGARPALAASERCPGLVFVGRADGSVEMWDLAYSLARPAGTWRVCRSAVATLAVGRAAATSAQAPGGGGEGAHDEEVSAAAAAAGELLGTAGGGARDAGAAPTTSPAAPAELRAEVLLVGDGRGTIHLVRLVRGRWATGGEEATSREARELAALLEAEGRRLREEEEARARAEGGKAETGDGARQGSEGPKGSSVAPSGGEEDDSVGELLGADDDAVRDLVAAWSETLRREGLG